MHNLNMINHQERSNQITNRKHAPSTNQISAVHNFHLFIYKSGMIARCFKTMQLLKYTNAGIIFVLVLCFAGLIFLQGSQKLPIPLSVTLGNASVSQYKLFVLSHGEKLPLQKQIRFGEETSIDESATGKFHDLLSHQAHLGWLFKPVDIQYIKKQVKKYPKYVKYLKIDQHSNDSMNKIYNLISFKKPVRIPLKNISTYFSNRIFWQAPNNTHGKEHLVPDSVKEIIQMKCFNKLLYDPYKLRKDLRIIRDRFLSEKIDLILDSGTLTGSWRYHDFIPYDYDIDFRIDTRESLRVRDIFKEFNLNSTMKMIFADTYDLNQHWKLGLHCSKTAKSMWQSMMKSVNAKYDGDSPTLRTDVMVSTYLSSCTVVIDIFFNTLCPNKSVTFLEPPQFIKWDYYYPLVWRPFMGSLFQSPASFENVFSTFYSGDALNCMANWHSKRKNNQHIPKMYKEMNNSLVQWSLNATCDNLSIPCSMSQSEFFQTIRLYYFNNTLYMELRIRKEKSSMRGYIDSIYTVWHL